MFKKLVQKKVCSSFFGHKEHQITHPIEALPVLESDDVFPMSLDILRGDCAGAS